MNFEITKIAPDTYQITDFNFVSLYLIVGSEKTVMIDSGFGVYDLNQYIKGYVSGELVLINTHIHPDHSNGNRHFSKTAIGAIEWNNHGLRWNSNTANIPEKWNPAASFEFPFLRVQLPDDFSARTYNQWVALGIPKPDFLLHNGDILELGNRELQVWHTPSHTTGSLCFFEPNLKLLFAGDAMSLKADWLLNLKSRAEPKDIFLTFSKLASRANEIEFVFPAHGTRPLEGAILKQIGEKMQQVSTGLLRGLPVQHRYGEAIKFDFGGYGPLMGTEVSNILPYSH